MERNYLEEDASYEQLRFERDGWHKKYKELLAENRRLGEQKRSLEREKESMSQCIQQLLERQDENQCDIDRSVPYYVYNDLNGKLYRTEKERNKAKSENERLRSKVASLGTAYAMLANEVKAVKKVRDHLARENAAIVMNAHQHRSLWQRIFR